MNGGPQFSIANAQQVFPLAKLALESHALGDSKRRDEAALDLLASPLAHEPVFPSGLVKVCRKSVSVTGLKQRQQLLERLLRLLELLDNCRAVHYHVISRYDLAAQSKTWRKIHYLSLWRQNPRVQEQRQCQKLRESMHGFYGLKQFKTIVRSPSSDVYRNWGFSFAQ
jgi:hypothetical protein